MKTFVITAAAAAALLAAAPAMAQPADESLVYAPSFYGNLGYSNFNSNSDTGAITGRLGARFGKYLGVEGEAAAGFATGQTHAYGGTDHVRMNDEYAGYAVGYLPLRPNIDLLARIGYGAMDSHVTGVDYAFGQTRSGVAYGVGGQYFFNGPNGVRLDYTRMDFGPTTANSNTWSLAYVRKF
ncbi:MAG: outer membrane beta-barrel protein [Caulobacteraceae bacterium]|nr:outer membrane beta-barrel protein [Caulobacteraceae bacterium]